MGILCVDHLEIQCKNWVSVLYIKYAKGKYTEWKYHVAVGSQDIINRIEN